MNPSNQNPTLGQPSTPEEDIALQAIESLDVEGSVEPIEPIPPAPDTVESSQTSQDEPIPTVSNPINDIKAMPPTTKEPGETASPPQPISLEANSSLAAANAEPAPATEAFQPFAQQKPTHSPAKILLIVLVVLIVLGGGAYFGWQYLQ